MNDDVFWFMKAPDSTLVCATFVYSSEAGGSFLSSGKQCVQSTTVVVAAGGLVVKSPQGS